MKPYFVDLCSTDGGMSSPSELLESFHPPPCYCRQVVFPLHLTFTLLNGLRCDVQLGHYNLFDKGGIYLTPGHPVGVRLTALLGMALGTNHINSCPWF